MRNSLLALVALGIPFFASAAGCGNREGGSPADGKAEAESIRAELLRAKAEAWAAREELAAARAEIDLKWCRDVAEHFLTALMMGHHDECRALGTKEYARRHPEVSATGYAGRSHWEITSHSVSPDGQRVSFQGPISVRQKFYLVLVKSDRGWKVDGFTYTSAD
jgi:hypothetical protein